MTQQDDLNKLLAVTLAVAYIADDQPQCVAAVALLERTAELLGLEVQPRAVSLLGQNQAHPDTPTFYTGRLAQEKAREVGIVGEPAGYSGAAPDASKFQRAGHVVGFTPLFNRVLDPSFGQFVANGFPNIVPCDPVDPTASEWWLQPIDGVGLTYYLDDANRDWQASYMALRDSAGEVAQEIVDHLRGGGEPHQLHGVYTLG